MTPLRRRMIEDLRIRNFSANTIAGYTGYVARFARHFGRSPADLGPEHVRTYLVHLREKECARAGTMRQAVAALRFLYRVTLKQDWTIPAIPYPKGFQRIRHYGLFANRHRKQRLETCRRYLVSDSLPTANEGALPAPAEPTAICETNRCSRCGAANLIRRKLRPLQPTAPRIRPVLCHDTS